MYSLNKLAIYPLIPPPHPLGPRMDKKQRAFWCSHPHSVQAAETLELQVSICSKGQSVPQRAVATCILGLVHCLSTSLWLVNQRE